MCDKARGTELAELARRFRVATAEAEARARVAQPWGADTSGFGLSRPLEEHQAPSATSSDKRKSSPPSGT